MLTNKQKMIEITYNIFTSVKKIMYIFSAVFPLVLDNYRIETLTYTWKINPDAWLEVIRFLKTGSK